MFGCGRCSFGLLGYCCRWGSGLGDALPRFGVTSRGDALRGLSTGEAVLRTLPLPRVFDVSTGQTMKVMLYKHIDYFYLTGSHLYFLVAIICKKSDNQTVYVLCPI